MKFYNLRRKNNKYKLIIGSTQSGKSQIPDTIVREIEKDKIIGSIYGGIMGDILGVPFEFMSREEVQKYNIFSHSIHGKHRQLFGAWSDDTSMTLCTVESLCHGYNLKNIGDNFVKWMDNGVWTTSGKLFDIGLTIKQAILKIKLKNDYSGINRETACGNGALMRIAPITFYIKKHPEEKDTVISEVTSLTHSNLTCIIASNIYIEFLLNLMNGLSKKDSYINMQETIKDKFKDAPNYLLLFKNILYNDILDLKVEDLKNTGYVVDTLETNLYTFMRFNDIRRGFKFAIKLGGDTDTIASIFGSMYGMYHGMSAINKILIHIIPKREKIDNLISNFINAYFNNFNNLDAR